MTAGYHSMQSRDSVILIAGALGNGEIIDTLGWDRALAKFVCGVLGTQADTAIGASMKVQGGDEAGGGDMADITGAVFTDITVDLNTIVTVVDLTNVALTIAAQPANPSRLVFTLVDTTPSITVGTFTIVGTDANGNALTEVIDAAAGAGTYRTVGVFASVTSITAADFATLGGSSDETIKVGHDMSGAGQERYGHLILIDHPRYIRMVSADVGGPASGAVVGSLILFQARREATEWGARLAGVQDFNV